MNISEDDFDKWGRKKRMVQSRPDTFLFQEREVWWCSLGYNIGSEENGKNENYERPVIVFRKFGDGVLWAIPITSSQIINNSRVEYPFILNGIAQTADIMQIRLISSKRLLRHIGMVSFVDFQKIRKIFSELG
jgi:mRNA-degrading endonuclease toxin of MazEF toxin-antitoxin module